MRRLMAAVAVGVITLAGCGSGQPPQREVATVLVTHLEHLHAGDFQAACALMNPAIRDYGPSCPEKLAQMMPAEQRAQMVNIAVDSSRVRLDDPTHATVPASAVTYSGKPAGNDDFHLIKIRDQWLVGWLG